MLERTVGCLETRGLRRLLPGSQKPLKSRRMLHSAFWNHGATDLEHSHLWASLIRVPGNAVDEHEGTFSKSVSNASAGSFLDFLYPSGALRLIRQYSLWKSETQDAQRTRTVFGRLNQRLYTSAATEAPQPSLERFKTFPDAEAREDNRTAPVICEPSSNSKPIESKLFYSFSDLSTGSQNIQDYDQAWRQFRRVDSKDRRSAIPYLLACLATSNRLVDADRAASVFEELGNTAGHDEYKSIVKLYLNCNMLQSAMKVFHEGLNKFDAPVGSDMLLAYALEKCRWQTACDIWISFVRFREKQPSLSYNIWPLSDQLDSLPDRAIKLADFVKGELDNPSGMKEISDSSNLVTFLLHRALLAMSDAKNLEPSRLNACLAVLQQWNADTWTRYEELVERLLDSGHAKFAIECYRQYRQRTTERISRRLLYKVLNVACQHHSVLGMHQILSDWIRFHESPSPAAYVLCMSAFARRGDVDTTEALFNQFVSHHRSPRDIKSAEYIAPLLHVHARRGELAEVVKIFDGIETHYGLKPTRRCWNILINAYGRAGDVEGAFSQFQRLLTTSLEPDHFTYGTLMGICTTRGDLDRAMELFQLAEGQGVVTSASMIDCLVLGHIQEDRLQQAEKICNDALGMDLRVPLTRMWNYLLTAYAMRRDLENVNRLLRRMRDSGVEYDGATYAALMQALAMVKQPDRAKAIMQKVMPEAGVEITSFHYGIIMGGYIATGELFKVFRIHNEMLRRNKNETISTRLMMMKASILQDQKQFNYGSQEEQYKRAKKYFYDAYIAPDAQEAVDNMRKGVGSEPLDIAYENSYFGYLMFVLGQEKYFYQAEQLYQQFIENAPEHHRKDLPLKILDALMTVSLKKQDYKSVQQFWDLAFEKAKKQGLPIRVLETETEPIEGHKILPLHKQALKTALSTQLLSLTEQQKFHELYWTRDKVEKAGFVLNNKNWNIYIQCLARAKHYKEAFDLCELRLMEGWSQWARAGQKDPEGKHLSRQLRRLMKDETTIFLRPRRRTLVLLGKAYIDLQDEAVESTAARAIHMHLERQCRSTIYALNTMGREDDELERDTLRPA